MPFNNKIIFREIFLLKYFKTKGLLDQPTKNFLEDLNRIKKGANPCPSIYKGALWAMTEEKVKVITHDKLE